MRRTVARAGEMGAIPTVMSFDVHPDTLVRGTEVPLINSAHGREELIRRLFGIESVVFITLTARSADAVADVHPDACR